MSGIILPVCDMLHREAEKILFPGAVAVDATVGKGNDTVFLAELVGTEGKVYGFDIQQQAIDITEQRLISLGLSEQTELFCLGHQNMTNEIKEGVDCFIFNLGYFPGGDHHITTTAESSIPALESALTLLNPGGVIFIALYWGHPEGEIEKEQIIPWLKELPSEEWCVSETTFPNRNKAPVLIEIERKKLRYRNGYKSFQTKNDSKNR